MSEASIDVYGRDKREVAEWILNTTGAFVLNKPLPERPRIVGAPKRGKGVNRVSSSSFVLSRSLKCRRHVTDHRPTKGIQHVAFCTV